MKKFHVHRLTKRGFMHTIGWAVLFCVAIVISTAALGRAAHNFKAALTDKPDIAIYLLLPDEKIGNTTLLREAENERDYLAETPEGPKLVQLRKGETEWYVAHVETLRE